MARPKKKPMSEINVVPYIDVMLVLLIIFMVTAPMLTQGIKVNLPQIESSEIELQSNQEPMIITVDVNGAYFLEMSAESGAPMELNELLSKASAILKQTPQISVLIRGDEDVAYGKVVALMSELQKVGASGVGLITEDI
jgi:biopolymer transport protein TolR